jgi:hypothetical protein
VGDRGIRQTGKGKRKVVNTKKRDIEILEELDNEEPNLCSIELIADLPGASGSMVIDQSLDITLRGELNAAMKAVRFLFPETPDPHRQGGVIYSLNREFIQHKMITRNEETFVSEGTDEATGIKIIFRANKASVDVGHLINVIRGNGGATYIEKGLRRR